MCQMNLESSPRKQEEKGGVEEGGKKKKCVHILRPKKVYVKTKKWDVQRMKKRNLIHK